MSEHWPESEITTELLARMRRSTAGDPAAGAADGVRLPAFGRDLDELFRRRRATRLFGDAPLTDTDLTELLEAAATVDRGLWNRGATEPELEALIVPRALDGRAAGDVLRRPLAPGAPLRSTGASIPPPTTVLQPELATAAAIVIVTGPLLDPDGAIAPAAGYRRLLLRGGAAAHGAWLRATDLGLVGTLAGVVVPHALAAAGLLDHWTRVPLVLLAVGSPTTYT